MTFVLRSRHDLPLSALSPAHIHTTAQSFNVNTETTTLGASLFLLSFYLNPILWGPLSELYGRQVPLSVRILGICCFEIGVAIALNIETIMICRLFARVFGSVPLAVVGGTLSNF